MTPKQLILIDIFIAFPLKVLSIILSFCRRTKNKDYGSSVLIIKFLGAGNFVAYADIINNEKFTVLTVLNNKATLQKFTPNVKTIFIDESSLLKLAMTIIQSSIILLRSSFSLVVNLESESSFAKFISSLPRANRRSGISNKHKSIFDPLFYSFFLVAPALLSRPLVLKALIAYDANINLDIKEALIAHNNEVDFFSVSDVGDSVIIAPTCSLTDANRRLTDQSWQVICRYLVGLFQSLVVVFPNSDDPQYDFFVTLSKEIPEIDIQVDGYKQFVETVLSASLLITIDSQALHVAQHKNIPTIAFYGPTSPYGVELGSNTYVISRSLLCSPCTHKYLRLPCQGENYCSQFREYEITEALNAVFSKKYNRNWSSVMP